MIISTILILVASLNAKRDCSDGSLACNLYKVQCYYDTLGCGKAVVNARTQELTVDSMGRGISQVGAFLTGSQSVKGIRDSFGVFRTKRQWVGLYAVSRALGASDSFFIAALKRNILINLEDIDSRDSQLISVPVFIFREKYPLRWNALQLKLRQEMNTPVCQNDSAFGVKGCEAMTEIASQLSLMQKEFKIRMTDLKYFRMRRTPELDSVDKRIDKQTRVDYAEVDRRQLRFCITRGDTVACRAIRNALDSLKRLGRSVNTGPSIWLKFALEPSAELNLVTDDILAGSLRGDCYDHAQLLRGLHAVGVLAPDQLRKAWRNIGLKAKCVEYPSGEGNFRVSPLYWFINVRRDIRFRRAEEMAFFRMGIEGQKSCMLNMGGPGCERVKSFYDSLSVIMGDQIVWPLPYIMERSK